MFIFSCKSRCCNCTFTNIHFTLLLAKNDLTTRQIYFWCPESAFSQLYCPKFSFKLVNVSMTSPYIFLNVLWIHCICSKIFHFTLKVHIHTNWWKWKAKETEVVTTGVKQTWNLLLQTGGTSSVQYSHIKKHSSQWIYHCKQTATFLGGHHLCCLTETSNNKADNGSDSVNHQGRVQQLTGRIGRTIGTA